MSNKMNVYYISIEGNTKHFLNKMSQVFKNIKLYEISDQSDLIKFKAPFFCFVPTYVKGTQRDPRLHEDETGENFGIKEMNTLTMNDELGYQKNSKSCLGLIGSGNKNFGEDCYCWTALHYHLKYHIPVVDDFEIRGTSADENRINNKMVEIWNKHVSPDKQVKKTSHLAVNPRLKKLQKKYGNLK